jgi:hypothetical protein
MCDTTPKLGGHGTTPKAAVRDLVDVANRPDIAWVEGIRGLPDRESQSDQPESIRCDLTVIYESKPVEQWHVRAVPHDDRWCTRLIGSKQIE